MLLAGSLDLQPELLRCYRCDMVALTSVNHSLHFPSSLLGTDPLAKGPEYYETARMACPCTMPVGAAVRWFRKAVSAYGQLP